jgi:hypothetical protein
MTGWPKRRQVPRGKATASSGKAARMLAKVRRIVGPTASVISLYVMQPDEHGVYQFHQATFYSEAKHDLS